MLGSEQTITSPMALMALMLRVLTPNTLLLPYYYHICIQKVRKADDTHWRLTTVGSDVQVVFKLASVLHLSLIMDYQD